MRRRKESQASDDREEGARPRGQRPLPDDEDDFLEAPAPPPCHEVLPEALLALCNRFGLEPWASARDDRGLWAFSSALAQWLERPRTAAQPGRCYESEVVRFLTNLFIILGAVIRPLPERPAGAERQAAAAVQAARQLLAARCGLVPPFPGAGRAMQRLVRVRGWSRLSTGEQTLAEALLSLYLETLAVTNGEPDAAVLLAASEAWLAVLHLRALPAGFDERLLRATSWYLETYTGSGKTVAQGLRA